MAARANQHKVRIGETPGSDQAIPRLALAPERISPSGRSAFGSEHAAHDENLGAIPFAFEDPVVSYPPLFLQQKTLRGTNHVAIVGVVPQQLSLRDAKGGSSLCSPVETDGFVQRK